MNQGQSRAQSRPPAALFGLAGEYSQQPGAPLAVNAETTAWEIYNDRAFTIDKELIKDWNDSLNTLLIFAALYSAVITAFIIESMKLLKEDHNETARDILLVITRQLANNSIPAFEPDKFIAPEYAVRVNYYFFLSISSSLVAALGAVLALQWVGLYDAGLNQSSPEKRALQRHFRYQGIEKWRMAQIIAFLPALLFISLFLFFIGLAEWLWTVHRGVAGIVIAGLVFGSSLFLVTALISMIYVGAPFRTPALRSLQHLFIGIHYSAVTFMSQLTLQEAVAASRRAMKRLTNITSAASSFWDHLRNKLATMFELLGSPQKLDPFEIREQRLVDSIDHMQRDALLWLVNRVDVHPNATNQLQAIIKQVLLLPPDQIVDPCIERAPWDRIFSLLLGQYLERTKEQGFSEEEIQDLQPKLQAFSLLWTVSTSQSFSFISFLDATRSLKSYPIRQLTLLADAKQHDNIRYLMEDLRTVIASVGCLPTHFLVAHLLRLWNRQTKEAIQDRILVDFSYRKAEGYKTLAQVLSCDLQDASSSTVIPQVMMDVVLDILAFRYFGSKPQGNTPLERYLLSFEIFYQEEQTSGIKQTALDIHGAIISQLLGLALQSIRQAKRPSQSLLLYNLALLLHANPSPGYRATTILALLEVMMYWKYTLWKPGSRLQTARIYAQVLSTPYTFTGSDWSAWRVRFYLGLDKLLQEKECFSATNKQLVWRHASIEAQWNGPKPELSASQLRQLRMIKDPINWLYSSAGCDCRWEYPPNHVVIAPGSRLAWNHALGSWCYDRRDKMHLNPSELAFIRSTILTRPVNMIYLTLRLANIQTVSGNPMSSSDWRFVLQRPGLGILLRGGDSRVSSFQPDHHLYGSEVLDGTVKILLRVSMHTWFFEEFRQADGFHWLVKMIETGRHSFLDSALATICLSLERARHEDEIVQWMVCLHQILASVKPTDSPHTIDNPEGFLDTIRTLYFCQEQCWMAGQGHSASSSSDSENLSSGVPVLKDHTYVRNWPEERWSRWRDMKEEIVDGLRRGFIGLGPSAFTIRLIRDPDGVCSCV